MKAKKTFLWSATSDRSASRRTAVWSRAWRVGSSYSLIQLKIGMKAMSIPW